MQENLKRIISNIEQSQKKKKNMTEKNIGQDFRLEEIDQTKNYFTEKIKQNELKSKKHKKLFRILNYNEHLLILASTAIGCVSFSSIAFLVDIPVGIATTIKMYF